MKINLRILCFILASTAILMTTATEHFVSFSTGDLQLNPQGKCYIYVDQRDEKGVLRAVNDLCNDFFRVTGISAEITTDTQKAQIIVGTLGHSDAIDACAKQSVIDAKQLKGKREKYIIKTTSKLFIAGSDRRGTIYGIYELSKQIGVSPWYDWADVPINHNEKIFVKKGTYTDGEPAVRYRGLFLNDEAPCLTSWVKNIYGTEYGDHRFYARLFELILRLKGNFMWPAMWAWAFYADDTENSRTADEMGIIMGTSHHEPMARNHEEWVRNRKNYGEWNYNTNQTIIDQFFREGIERMKGTEDIVTIAMRGDGDEAMSEEADTKLLEKIVKNQRKIIEDVTGRPAKETPQVWALYKEVLDYYDKGMRVPDDVTIMLCDDNWGNVRRVPTEKERSHKGGWGLYYHVDYVGAPRNSKWLNVTQTQQMHEQLSLAYDHGIDRVWILNVGDLKPMEYPIQLFMDMAWSPKDYSTANIIDHTQGFFSTILGEDQGKEATEIYNRNCQYAARVTAEMLDSRTFNLASGEWRKVRDDYTRLERRALQQFITLPKKYNDFYRQIVLFPVQAMANVYDMYYAQAMNLHLATQADPDANKWAEEVIRCFKRDSLLCAQYNTDIANGKWNGFMVQKHIGYRSWNDDFAPFDVLPYTASVKPRSQYTFAHSNGYVAMDAERYYSASTPVGTQWTLYPDYGRTRSAIALTPYTHTNVEGAALTYRFSLPKDCPDSVTIHVITKSTLDYLNVGGHKYGVAMDDATSSIINMNGTLVDRQPYVYSIYYPTVAARVIDKTITLPISKKENNIHTLTITPKHPGIVFEKIVVDYGGYSPSYLFMDVSPLQKK